MSLSYVLMHFIPYMELFSLWSFILKSDVAKSSDLNAILFVLPAASYRSIMLILFATMKVSF